MKTAIVTGASRGIGASTAIALGEKGYNVLVHYLNHEQEAHCVRDKILSFGGDAFCMRADVSDSAEAAALVDSCVERFGGIDLLVNNAGISEQLMVQDITDDKWAKMLHTNLSGAFYTCRRAVPHFVRQKSGVIVNVSSVWGITGASCEVHYSASKAGLIGLTLSLAKELAPCGIRVNCVAPGVVDTQMNAVLGADTLAYVKNEIPLGRFAAPEEIAGLICFLASDSASYITGQVIKADGGWQ